jgi:hypothetical protein
MSATIISGRITSTTFSVYVDSQDGASADDYHSVERGTRVEIKEV